MRKLIRYALYNCAVELFFAAIALSLAASVAVGFIFQNPLAAMYIFYVSMALIVLCVGIALLRSVWSEYKYFYGDES